jgi:hypothetical protein
MARGIAGCFDVPLGQVSMKIKALTSCHECQESAGMPVTSQCGLCPPMARGIMFFGVLWTMRQVCSTQRSEDSILAVLGE